MYPCPKCGKQTKELLRVTDNISELQCPTKGCYSRFIVIHEIADIVRHDRLEKNVASGKSKAGRKQLQVMPCPDCARRETLILRCKDVNDITIRRVQCVHCFTKYTVMTRFVEWIREGPTRLNIKNTKKFIEQLSDKTKRKLLEELILETSLRMKDEGE